MMLEISPAASARADRLFVRPSARLQCLFWQQRHGKEGVLRLLSVCKHYFSLLYRCQKPVFCESTNADRNQEQRLDIVSILSGKYMSESRFH